MEHASPRGTSASPTGGRNGRGCTEQTTVFLALGGQTEDALQSGDPIAAQKRWLQQKKEKELVQRLERRMSKQDALYGLNHKFNQIVPAEFPLGSKTTAATDGHQVLGHPATPREAVQEGPAVTADHINDKPALDEGMRDSASLVAQPAAQNPGQVESNVGPQPTNKGAAGVSEVPHDPIKATGTYEELGDLTQYNTWRRCCILICAHPDFELLVVLVIMSNCVTLALYDPMQDDSSEWNTRLFWTELGLNVFYSVEAVVRMVSLGGVLSYLKHPWNVFDVFMVATGYTALIPTDSSSGSNTAAIRALRALRALRPLRTITRFESLRAVVICFMEAAPLLLAVAGVLVVFLFMYAVGAVQMYTGVFHNACAVEDSPGVPFYPLVLEQDVRVVDDLDMYGCSGETDPSPAHFWTSLRTCPSNFTCVTTAETTARHTGGFDNVGLAMLTNFQCLTLTSWAYIMYRTMDASSPFAVIYFVTLIVLGAYFVMNLFLAVLKAKFAKAQSVFEVKAKLKQTTRRKNTLAKLFSSVKSKVSSLSERKSQGSLISQRMQSLISQKMSKLSQDTSANKQQQTAVQPKGSLQKPTKEAEQIQAGALSDQRSSDGTDFHHWSLLSDSSIPTTMGTASTPRAHSRCDSVPPMMDDSSRALHVMHVAAAHAAPPSPSPARTSPSGPGHSPPHGGGGGGLKKGGLTKSKSVVIHDHHEAKGGLTKSKSVVIHDLHDLHVSAPPAASKHHLLHHADGNTSIRNVRFTGGGQLDADDGAADSERVSLGTNSRVKWSGGEEHARGSSSPRPPHHAPPHPRILEVPSTIPSSAELQLPLQLPADPSGHNSPDAKAAPADVGPAGGPGASSMKGDADGGPVAPQMVDGNMAMMMMSVQEFDEFVLDLPFHQRTWLRVQFRLRLLATHPMFDNTFLLLILVNTVLLAIEYDGMPSSMVLTLSEANTVLTALFTSEVVLKLAGFGFWEFIRDGFNLFDTVIVALSLVELCVGGAVAGGNALRALRIIRALRVLRLFKLFRYVRSMRRIAEVLLNSFTSFAAIVVLLSLFWLVFAIIGMHVFGGIELAPGDDYPNFNTFLNSLVSTFNILNMENWNQQMYAVVRATNWGATSFFVLWIIIGKYTLLSLFLAVTLEAFEAKYDASATMGGLGSAVSSFISGMKSRLSSMGNSVNSLRQSLGSRLSSGRKRGSVEKPRPRPVAEGVESAGSWHLGATGSSADQQAREGSPRGPHSPRPPSRPHRTEATVHTLEGSTRARYSMIPGQAGAPSGPTPVPPTVQRALHGPAHGRRSVEVACVSTNSFTSRHSLQLEGAVHVPDSLRSMSVDNGGQARPYVPPALAPAPPSTQPPDAWRGSHSGSYATPQPGVQRTPSFTSASPYPPSAGNSYSPGSSPLPSPRSSNGLGTRSRSSISKQPSRLRLAGSVMPDPNAPPPFADDHQYHHHHMTPSSLATMFALNENEHARPHPPLASPPHHQDMLDVFLSSQGSITPHTDHTLMTTTGSYSVFLPAYPGHTPDDSEQQPSQGTPSSSLPFPHPFPHPPRPGDSMMSSMVANGVMTVGAANGSYDDLSRMDSMQRGLHASTSHHHGAYDDPYTRPASTALVPHMDRAMHLAMHGHGRSPLGMSTGGSSAVAYQASSSGSWRARPTAIDTSLSGRPSQAADAAAAFDGGVDPFVLQQPGTDAHVVSMQAGLLALQGSLVSQSGGGGRGSQAGAQQQQQGLAPQPPAPDARPDAPAPHRSVHALMFPESAELVPAPDSDSAPPVSQDVTTTVTMLSFAHQLQGDQGGAVPGRKSLDQWHGSLEVKRTPSAAAELLHLAPSPRRHTPDSPMLHRHHHHHTLHVDDVDLQNMSSRRPSPPRPDLVAGAAAAAQQQQQQNDVLPLGPSPRETAAAAAAAGAAQPPEKGPPQPGTKATAASADAGAKEVSAPAAGLPRAMSRSDSMGSMVSSDAGSHGHHGHDPHKTLSPEEEFRRKQRERNGAVMIEGTGPSLWYFDEDHPVRLRVYDAVVHKRYDQIMLLIIFLNCLGMALEGPHVDHASPLGRTLYWSDVAFTAVFGVEVALKTFAFTFRAYIKQLTNQVDLLIVVVSIAALALESIAPQVTGASVLRVLRALKPLRLLTRSPGMRMVFKSIMLSMAAMANVSLVCAMFFLIFAILGTQLFMGLLWSCNDTSVDNKDECTGLYTHPVTGAMVERAWQNAFPNFDNVGNSLIVCFITATLNGYTQTMTQAMAAPKDKDGQPAMNQNPGAFFWFLGFVFVCAFVLLNLYVGVIFSQFSRIRLFSTTGSAFLTSSQQEWAGLAKMVFKLKPAEKPSPPRNPVRRLAYALCINAVFDSLIMGLILANVAVLALRTFDTGEGVLEAMSRANTAFVAAYCAELVLKVTALGPAAYWRDTWHKLDVALVAAAVLDLALGGAVTVGYVRAVRVLQLQRMLRVMRAARLVQLVKVSTAVKSLFATLLAAMPAFGNVGALIGLFFYMYAYMGVVLLGTLRWNVGVNEHVNFKNFLSASLVLLRVATGDNWSNVLMDALPQRGCVEGEGVTCGTWLALPYFLSFVLLVSVILLNLFTAVIIEAFEKTHEQEDWKLTPAALEDFVSLWSEFDDGSGTISPTDLEGLLRRLEPPLGLGGDAAAKDVLRFVYDLDIPLTAKGRVPFHKTVFELVKRVSQSAIPDGALKEQLDKMVERFFKHLHTEESMNISVAVSVARLQRWWRARLRMSHLKERRQWRQMRLSGKSDAVGTLAPWGDYTSLVRRRRPLMDAYQNEKQEARQALLGVGVKKLGISTPVETLGSRWRFNPVYTPHAEALEKAGGTSVLRQIMSTFRGNGVKSGGNAKSPGFLGGSTRGGGLFGGSVRSGHANASATSGVSALNGGQTEALLAAQPSPTSPTGASLFSPKPK